VILNSGALLIQIFNQIEKSRDIYDLVKDYVEFSQNSLFNKLELQLLLGDSSNNHFGKMLATCMKLERWIVMFFFFFSFNKVRLRKLKPMLLQMARITCENFYCMMISVRSAGSEGLDLEEVKKEISDLMSKNGFSLQEIAQNREEYIEGNIRQLIKSLNTW
jgi:hypothetical protein